LWPRRFRLRVSGSNIAVCRGLSRQQRQLVHFIIRNVLDVAHIDGANAPVRDNLPAPFPRQIVAPRDFPGRPSANEIEDGQPPLQVTLRPLAENGRLGKDTWLSRTAS
jgi:hypothetical protein